MGTREATAPPMSGGGTMRATTRSTALATAAVLLLALAGCTPSGTDEDTRPSADASAPDRTKDKDSGGDKSKGGADDPTGTTEPDPDPEPDHTAVGTGPDCLIGTWEGDNDVQAEAARALLAEQGMIGDVTVTGTARSTYDGTRVTTTYVDQVSTTVMDVDGSQVLSVQRYDGTLTASYTATETDIVLVSPDASGLEITMENTVDGEPMDMTAYEDLMLAGMAVGGMVTYTCTADLLVVTPVAAGLDMGMYTTELHRL